MKKYIRLTLLFCVLTVAAFSQSDTSATNAPSDVFARIAGSVKEFRLDTSAAPDDKITRKIIELRSLRGGFNINEAINFKIAEDRQKHEMPEAELERLSNFFQSGNGKRWLDNAIKPDLQEALHL